MARREFDERRVSFRRRRAGYRGRNGEGSGAGARRSLDHPDRRRRSGHSRDHQDGAARLHFRRPPGAVPVRRHRGRGAQPAGAESGHRRGAAGRGHGIGRCRPAAGAHDPQRAEQPARAHHPAHRPAGAGAGTRRHPELRHQRLQIEDGADGAEAVHLGRRRSARLSGHHRHRGPPPGAGAHPGRLLRPARQADHGGVRPRRGVEDRRDLPSLRRHRPVQPLDGGGNRRCRARPAGAWGRRHPRCGGGQAGACRPAGGGGGGGDPGAGRRAEPL
ncbi:hypothetical protein FBZ81_10693 [Azospirillum brasilense]|nr:hypothetical protein FBZ81_10693 [Azospirillum brasilense]